MCVCVNNSQISSPLPPLKETWHANPLRSSGKQSHNTPENLQGGWSPLLFRIPLYRAGATWEKTWALVNDRQATLSVNKIVFISSWSQVFDATWRVFLSSHYNRDKNFKGSYVECDQKCDACAPIVLKWIVQKTPTGTVKNAVGDIAIYMQKVITK